MNLFVVGISDTELQALKLNKPFNLMFTTVFLFILNTFCS